MYGNRIEGSWRVWHFTGVNVSFLFLFIVLFAIFCFEDLNAKVKQLDWFLVA